jgi:hypothetical protein
MSTSDKQIPLKPEGTYEMRLKTVGFVKHGRFYGTKLSFDENDDNSTVLVTVFGNIDHVTAWKRCLGQTFRIRIKHRTFPSGVIVLDTRVMS